MNDNVRHIFSGMQILIDRAWQKNHAVVVEAGVIQAIIPEDMIQHHLPAKKYEFPEDYFLIPGLIDIHIHGAKGHDVMDGTEEALQSISLALAEEGITGFLATTMTSETTKIENVLKILSSAINKINGAAILGVHLEGPFISKEKCGAQPKEFCRNPDSKLFRDWQKISGNNIKLVTLAPELPDALSFIKMLHETGVIPSIGHTNATYAETSAAILSGARQATHFFNAMSGLHQREPGATGAILLSKEVTAEIIVDGVHLHPAVVNLISQVKGKENLILVTDAMRAKCCKEGNYDLGGQQVTVHQHKATLADGTLAGSILKMPTAIKNMMEFIHCSLADAIIMASFNPALMLGLETKKGTITKGKDADLVVLNSQLDVMMTVCEGRLIYQR